MHMTFEKIEPPAAPADEHPAARAARMIKELHLENIAKMNAGHVFYATKDGELVNVNQTIREQCMEQIDMCNKIIDSAPFLKPESIGPATKILGDVVETLKEAQSDSAVEMPEIGNYDHKE